MAATHQLSAEGASTVFITLFLITVPRMSETQEMFKLKAFAILLSG
jgi:hypothetical protein